MPFVSIPEPAPVPALPSNVASRTWPTVVIMLLDAGNYAAAPGQIGTIVRSEEWRADRQRGMADYVNIQIQRQGVGAPSTVACLLVPRNLQQFRPKEMAPPGRAPSAENRFRELTHAIQTGLILSHQSLRPAGRGNERVESVLKLSGDFAVHATS